MTHRPAADAVIQIEQTGLVGDLRAGLGRNQAARGCRRDRRRGGGQGGRLLASPAHPPLQRHAPFVRQHPQGHDRGLVQERLQGASDHAVPVIAFPLEALGEVEILKGSGSTLYGSDAVGGVVHFVTRRPEASEVRLRGALGNFGVNQERATVSLVDPRISEQLSFSRDFSTGFIPNRDYRNLSLASSTHFDTPIGSTAVRLAHRRSGHDLNRKVEVDRHPPDQGLLLVVLGAEHGDVRLDEVEQL